MEESMVKTMQSISDNENDEDNTIGDNINMTNVIENEISRQPVDGNIATIVKTFFQKDMDSIAITQDQLMTSKECPHVQTKINHGVNTFTGGTSMIKKRSPTSKWSLTE